MPQRRQPTQVPQGVEAANQLITGRETSDIIALAFIPTGIAAMIYLAGLLTLIQMGAVIGLIMGLNYTIFKLVPENESVIYWVRSFYAYQNSPSTILKKGISAENIEQDITVDTEVTGGRDITEGDETDLISTSESTQDVSMVQTIDTYSNTIELTNGDIVSMIRIMGMERNLIDQNLKQKADESFNNFLSSDDYDISIRCSSAPFPIDSEIDNFEKRLQDEEIVQRPILKRNIKSKMKFVDTRIRSLGMNHREYYLIIRVSPTDQSVDDGGPFDLDFIHPNSFIGKQLRQRATGDTSKTQQENLKEMVNSRTRSTKRSIGQIRQIATKEMNGEEMARAFRSYYKGKKGTVNGWEPSSEVAISADTNEEVTAS